MPVLKLCAMDWEDRFDLMDSFCRTKRAKEVRRGLKGFKKQVKYRINDDCPKHAQSNP